MRTCSEFYLYLFELFFETGLLRRGGSHQISYCQKMCKGPFLPLKPIILRGSLPHFFELSSFTELPEQWGDWETILWGSINVFTIIGIP